MQQQKIIGMIFPITNEMLSILKKREKAVLCKFTPQESIPKYLKIKQKVVFYFSRHLVGEGIIREINLTSPLNIIRKYIKNLLITKKEFKNYVGMRSSKKLLLLKLSNLKIYKAELSPIYPVPMSGRYIREREHTIIGA